MAGDYNRLSAADKEREVRRRIREPGVTCPICETTCGVDDLLAHIEERCTGPRDAHPHSRWVNWTEALALGISKATLHHWVRSGRVRTESAEPRGSRYLLRDLAMCIARQKRRSKTRTGAKRGTKRKGKRLTKRKRRNHGKTMSGALNKDVIERLEAFAAKVGGFAPAARVLDIPADTLRRAAAGERLRRATRKEIEQELERAGDAGRP